MNYTADINHNLIDEMETLCDFAGISTTDFLEEAIANQIEVVRKRNLEPDNSYPYSKAVGAACKMLEGKGYAVLEEGCCGAADIVAEDEDGTLVFVAVRALLNEMPDESLINKTEMELFALRYCSENEVEDANKVRFDNICFAISDNDKAIARHHVNCFEKAA